MNGYVIGLMMGLTVLYTAMLASSLATVYECWRAEDYVATGFWAFVTGLLFMAGYSVLDAVVYLG